MSSRPKWLLPAIVIIGLSVAGCSADEKTPTAAGGPSTPPTVTPKPTPTSTPTVPTRAATTRPPSPTITSPAITGPIRLTKGMTRPGARLRFGQQAIVPVQGQDSFTKEAYKGVVGITVGTIRRAPAAQIEGNFDARSRALLKGKVAYYATVVITNESGTDLSAMLSPQFHGLRSGGRPTQFALIGGELPACPEDSASTAFSVKGARWVTCALAVSTAAGPVRAFEYEGPPYGKELQLFDDPPPRYNHLYNLGAIRWH